MGKGMSWEDEIQTEVLIVGGALVGLSTSLFLGKQGISSLLVERHPEPARLPRARGYNARTMELFRAIGLEETIRAAQSPTAANRGVVRVESLAGRELLHLDEGGIGDLAPFTPTSACIIGQERFEPILCEEAQKLGSEICFNTEMLSFEQDEDGVSAFVRERATGEERRIRAQYLIAADGSHSRVRGALGIRTRGQEKIAYSTDVAFEADLSEARRGRSTFLYMISNPNLPDGRGGLMPLDNQRRWSFGTVIHPERGERREDITDERCIELIRIATGVPDLEVKVLPAYPWDAVKVGVWELEARYAEQYRQERVFLVGDAAHASLPSGGFGAGTGIQDAFNLTWKLALVLKGKADVSLLASYEDERLPVGKLVVEQSLKRYFYRVGTEGAAFFSDAEMLFGFRYVSSAILSELDSSALPLMQDPSTLGGDPGTRAPHFILEAKGVPVSTIDLCGGNWTLFIGSQDTAWAEAASHLTRKLEIPLHVYTLDGEGGLRDPEGRWHEAYGIEPTGAILIRPDGFVAWRSSGLVTNQASLLEQVFVRLLGKQCIS